MQSGMCVCACVCVCVCVCICVCARIIGQTERATFVCGHKLAVHVVALSCVMRLCVVLPACMTETVAEYRREGWAAAAARTAISSA
jgi:hypothetical protein